MIRFPWMHRGDEEQRQRVAAEQRLAAVEGDWPRVHETVRVTREQASLNGWTRTVVAIFAGRD